MHSPQARPQLAPGLRVVRRGLHQVQVGLHAGRRTLLPRSETVERALAVLLERLPVDDDPAVQAVLLHLDRHGLLTWERRASGARSTVAVLGLPEVRGLPDLRELFDSAGLTLTRATHAVDAVVVLNVGELDRALLDPLVRERTSHVVARLVDGCAIVGPFVVPGVTACLRCIDAHQSEHDPDHVAVTARYVRATEHRRSDGVVDVDPTLAALTLAWAVRDVVAHLEGREPSTWSRTILLSPDPAQRSERRWLRHPRCGCSWPTDDHMSGTM